MKPWTLMMMLATCAFGAEPAGVGLSLSASSGIPAGLQKDEWIGEDAESFPKLTYAGTTKDGKLTLAPKLTLNPSEKKAVNYMDLLKSGGPLSPIGYSSDVNLSFPALDVKLVNNGKQAVHFSSAVIKVAKSTPDPTPLPLLFSDYSQVQCFELDNEGWDSIDSVKFDFAITASEPKGKAQEEFPFSRTFQRVKEHLRISLTDELAKAGVAPELTAAGKTYLDAEAARDGLLEKAASDTNLDEDPPFQKAEEAVSEASTAMFKLSPKLAGKFEESCWVHGRMALEWKDGEEVRKQVVTFRCKIMLFPPDGLGAVGPVAGKYEAMLRESGENYELPIDVSRVVKPSAVDRFVITLGIPRTSKHELSIELKTTEGETLTSGPVSIQGLLPRSSASELGQTSSEEP
ncbi:MAG: hypothetical protein ABIS50_26635 [Luteolibacter sp.]|uniref:hypothetical protein n=1 Tax=Luteolibacter sp. TaxID=1962973 RepID=UPI003262FE44